MEHATEHLLVAKIAQAVTELSEQTRRINDAGAHFHEHSAQELQYMYVRLVEFTEQLRLINVHPAHSDGRAIAGS